MQFLRAIALGIFVLLSATTIRSSQLLRLALNFLDQPNLQILSAGATSAPVLSRGQHASTTYPILGQSLWLVETNTRFQWIAPERVIDPLYRTTVMDQLLPAASSTTLVVAVNQRGQTTYYAKDANHVYFVPYLVPNATISIVPGADPETFRIISPDGGLAADNTHIYVGDYIANIDASSFTFLMPCAVAADYGDCLNVYAKDKNHVFFVSGSAGGDILEIVHAAAPSTFVTLGNVQGCGDNCLIDAYDKNATYWAGVPNINRGN